MMKIMVSILVDADNETAVYDGLNEVFNELEGQNMFGGFIVDWALFGTPPTPYAIPRDQYNEGDAFE